MSSVARIVAARGIPDSFAEYLRQPIPLDRKTGFGRVRQGEQVAISLDLAAEEPYRAGNPRRRVCRSRSSPAFAPKRAGSAIWGSEREPPQFSESNNCRDPFYRSTNTRVGFIFPGMQRRGTSPRCSAANVDRHNEAIIKGEDRGPIVALAPINEAAQRRKALSQWRS